ncbi:adhesion G protein-coupled receptor E3-like [Carettochelys insculpta]|uniref:adhesion G protein-coupled receptor E3-like n=1 Tax=Carettochelys insculpta TaxID=44489 RepID=UPI003EB7C8B6
MGTRGDVRPLIFFFVVLIHSLTPGSIQASAAGGTENCPDIICPANAKCVNSTHCTCLDGFKHLWNQSVFDDTTETCDDINECLGPNPVDCGPFTNCTNVPGSYYCTCLEGYESSSGKANFTSASETTCQDIDKCREMNGTICGPNANCTNLPGSHICTCSDGAVSSSGKANFTHASENTCQVRTNNHSTELERIKERCRNLSWQGELSSGNSSFGSFFDSTVRILRSVCKDGSSALSLEEVIHALNSSLNRSSYWANGGKEEVAEAVTFLLQVVEVAALDDALRSPGNITQKAVTHSVAIETRLITRNNCRPDSEPLRLSAYGESMTVHCDTVLGATTQAGLGAAAFIAYSTLHSIFTGNLLATGKLENTRLNSRVVSGAIGDGSPVNLSTPANFTLSHEQLKKEEERAICVYWNLVDKKGSWSPDGCVTLSVNDTYTTCSCNHLSSFAILMVPSVVTESYPLTIITYVGLALSLLCLLLAILTFLLCRSIWNISTSIHLQLCLCLFLGNLLFLIGMTQTERKVACKVIAGLLHFIFLACFTWMFLEGLHLFLTVRNLKVVNYTSASRFKKRYMYPFGYGFPALIVAISAAIKPGGYGTSQHCWLSLDQGFHWSFLGPVCAIILINVIFFALTLWMLKDRLSSLNTDVSTLRDHRLLTFKAIAQVFILGCTWSLGLLQFGPAAKVMAYLFTIINLLQGPFIFLVHCLLNRQVREEYRRWFSRIQTSSMRSESYDVSMSTVHTSSSKAM